MNDTPKTNPLLPGYRVLSEEELTLLKNVKRLESTIMKSVEALSSYPPPGVVGAENLTTVDSRWLAIAKTNLQIGFMAMVRSIAKPADYDVSVDDEAGHI